VYNKIILVGHTGKEVKTNTLQSGSVVAHLSVATSRKTKEGAELTTWFDVTAWGKLADFAGKYLGAGASRLVLVEGRIESRKYTTREGVEKEAWEVTADTIRLLDRPPGGAASNGGEQGEF
jgi:single-strand DNA-binding protein